MRICGLLMEGNRRCHAMGTDTRSISAYDSLRTLYIDLLPFLDITLGV